MNDLSTTDFNVVLLLLRVPFGLTFAAHGYAKRFPKDKLAGTARWFDSIGMKPGRLHAQAASLTEIATGLALAIGILTPFAAAGVIGVMTVAGYTVHRGRFFIVKDGWEYTFICGLIAATIAGLGPGEWSVDQALGLVDALNGITGLAIAIVIGAAAGIAQIGIFYRPPQTGD